MHATHTSAVSPACSRLARSSPRARLAAAAAVSLLALAAGGAHADVIISDDTFLDTNWFDEVISNANDAWAHTVGQSLDGGNPGAYRGQDWSTSAGGDNLLITFNGFSGGTYNPAVSGGIANVSYDYDTIVRKPDGSSGVVFINPAVKQGDSIYVTSYSSFLADSANWKHAARPTIAAAAFVKVTGTGAAKPDFSASGAPLTFGYNNWLRADNYAVHHGVDNFRVSLAPLFTGGTTTGHFAVNVDLGDRSAYTGQGALPTTGDTWNALNGAATPINSLKNSEGAVTSVGYRWSPYTQFDTLQPINAVGDYLDGERPQLTSDGALNGVAGDATPGKFGGEMFLNGLVPNSKHKVVLYGTLYGETGDRVHTTTFTVNGKPLSTTSLADGEGLNYVVFNDVPADANGEIFIRMRNASVNVDGRSNGGYWALNGFQLESLGVANPTYVANASGNISTAANWSGGVPTGAGAIAEFKGTDAANITVSLDAPRTIGTVGFGGTRSYKLSGSALTLDGANGFRGVVNVASGSHEIAAPLAFGAAGGELIIAANAKLKLSGTVDGTVGRLSLGTGATLDLATTSPLILDYDRFSNLATVNAAVASGRAAGGTGITSSLVAANPNFAVIVTESAAVVGASGGTYRGHAVDATSLIVGVFLRGDADLSSKVEFADLLTLAKNYNLKTGATWKQGDSDFDGAVGFADLLALAKNYNQSLPTSAAFAASGVSEGFQADVALAFALVPEPTSFALLGGLGMLGLRRQRRARAD